MAVEDDGHPDARAYYNALQAEHGSVTPDLIASRAFRDGSRVHVEDGVIHVIGDSYDYEIEDGDVFDNIDPSNEISGALPHTESQAAAHAENVGHNTETAPNEVPTAVNAPEKDRWGVPITRPGRSAPVQVSPEGKPLKRGEAGLARTLASSRAWALVHRRGLPNEARLWLSDVVASAKEGAAVQGEDPTYGVLTHHEHTSTRTFNDGSQITYRHKPAIRTEGVDAPTSSKQITGLTVTVPHLKGKRGAEHTYDLTHDVVSKDGVDTIIGGTGVLSGTNDHGQEVSASDEWKFGQVPLRNKEQMSPRVEALLRDQGVDPETVLRVRAEGYAAKYREARARGIRQTMMEGNRADVERLMRQLVAAGHPMEDVDRFGQQHLGAVEYLARTKHDEEFERTASPKELHERKDRRRRAAIAIEDNAHSVANILTEYSAKKTEDLTRASPGVDIHDPVEVVRDLVTKLAEYHPDPNFDAASQGLENPGTLGAAWRAIQTSMQGSVMTIAGKSIGEGGKVRQPTEKDADAAHAWDLLQDRFSGGVPNVTFKDPVRGLRRKMSFLLRGKARGPELPPEPAKSRGRDKAPTFDLSTPIRVLAGEVYAQHKSQGGQAITPLSLDQDHPTEGAAHRAIVQSTTLQELHDKLLQYSVPHPEGKGRGAQVRQIRFAAHMDGEIHELLGQRVGSRFEFRRPERDRAFDGKLKFAVFSHATDKWTDWKMGSRWSDTPWSADAEDFERTPDGDVFAARRRLRRQRSQRGIPPGHSGVELQASPTTPQAGTPLHAYPLADPDMAFDSGIAHENGVPLIFQSFPEAVRHIRTEQSRLPEGQRLHYVLPLEQDGSPKETLPASIHSVGRFVEITPTRRAIGDRNDGDEDDTDVRSQVHIESKGWNSNIHKLVKRAYQRHIQALQLHTKYHSDVGDSRTPAPEPVQQEPMPVEPPTQSTQTGASGQRFQPVDRTREMPKDRTIAGKRARGAGSWR